MSSREEELKKYLAKRERKKNRPDVVEQKESRPVVQEGKKDPHGFFTFFYLVNGNKRWITTTLVSVAVAAGVIALVKYSGSNNPHASLLLIISAFLSVHLIFLARIYSRFATFTKLVSGKLYPFIGWNHFITSRSDSFWDGSVFVHVSISFDQNHTVPELERKALATFMTTWVNTWGYQYKTDWTNGRPKEFHRTAANRLDGHVTVGSMRFVINQLMDDLPELMKLLTPDTLRVSIGTAGPELYTRVDDAEEKENMRREDQRYRDNERREQFEDAFGKD